MAVTVLSILLALSSLGLIILGRRLYDVSNELTEREEALESRNQIMYKQNADIGKLQSYIADLKDPQGTLVHSDEATIDFEHNFNTLSYLPVTGTVLLTKTEKSRILKRQRRYIGYKKACIFKDVDVEKNDG